MRVLMITDAYPPIIGGVEKHVQTLSAELIARGHDVAVTTLWREGLDTFECDGAVRVHRIRGTLHRAPQLFRNPGRAWAPPFPDPELVAALRGVVAKERPMIVHGHDWLVRSFLPLKYWSQARLVTTLHYYTLTCAKKSLMYRGAPCTGPGFLKCLGCGQRHYGYKGMPIAFGNWAMGSVERVLVDMFIPVSRATAVGNGLVDSGLPYRVIPNLIPHAINAPSDDNAPYLAQLPPDGFLLFVGDFVHDKGINVLLQAYAGLKDAPPLVLIGKPFHGSPTEYPENVVVLKNWPNHAVMEAWRRCSIALVPSIWPEPFGIVVTEAMMSGRPVIASRIGGIPDIVADEETGVLVPPGDPGALRGALARLLADKGLCKRMGAAGKERVANFHASVVVPQIEEVYRTVLERPEAPRARERIATVSDDASGESS